MCFLCLKSQEYTIAEANNSVSGVAIFLLMTYYIKGISK